jgi:hypothetical protein
LTDGIIGAGWREWDRAAHNSNWKTIRDQTIKQSEVKSIAADSSVVSAPEIVDEKGMNPLPQVVSVEIRLRVFFGERQFSEYGIQSCWRLLNIFIIGVHKLCPDMRNKYI